MRESSLIGGELKIGTRICVFVRATIRSLDSSQDSGLDASDDVMACDTEVSRQSADGARQVETALELAKDRCGASECEAMCCQCRDLLRGESEALFID